MTLRVSLPISYERRTRCGAHCKSPFAFHWLQRLQESIAIKRMTRKSGRMIEEVR